MDVLRSANQARLRAWVVGAARDAWGRNELVPYDIL